MGSYSNRLMHAIPVLIMLVSGALFSFAKEVPGEMRKGDMVEIVIDNLPDSLRAAYFYTEGIIAREALQQTGKAIEMLEKAVSLDEHHAPSYYELSQLYVRTDMPKALEAARTASDLDSTNIWYKALLGRILLYDAQYEEALGIYEQLLKLAPHDPENYRMLAALYDYRRQPFSAITILDSAEYKLGKFDELSGFKQELLMRVGLVDRAIEETEDMVRENPYKFENYLVLAELYAQQNKDSLAMVNYGRAMEQNPEGIEVLGSLNDYYRNKNDLPNFFDTSRKLFRTPLVDEDTKLEFLGSLTHDRAFYRSNYLPIKELSYILLMNYPDSFPVIDQHATIMIDYGDIEDALALYKSYIDNDRVRRLELFNVILEMEAYLGNPDSVRKYSDIALAYYPDDTGLYIKRGGMQYYLGDLKGALTSYNLALKHARTDSLRSVVNGIIGDTWHQQKNTSKAYSYYKKALKLWPDNSLVLNNYAYYLSEEGSDLELALEMAVRAVKLSPGNSTTIDTYGWVLYKLGRLEEAREQIKKAISLDRSGSSELLIHYGDIMFDLGDGFMASLYWKRALEAGYDADEIERRMKRIENL